MSYVAFEQSTLLKIHPIMTFEASLKWMNIFPASSSTSSPTLETRTHELLLQLELLKLHE